MATSENPAGMTGAYEWQYTIASYDVGPTRRLRLSNQLKLQQEVGEKQLEQSQLPYTYLYDTLGVIFVLVRTASVIYRAPVFEESIRLSTWCRGLKGAQYLRCYRFCDEAGNVLIDSATTFALIDTKQHRLVRPSTIKEFEGFVFLPEKENTCPPPGKIILPEGMEKADDRRLYDSDMDYNGHLNNSIYADFLTDYMPGGIAGKVPTGFQIHFAGEAGLGESLEIETALKGDTAYYSGRHPRGQCFTASCTFRPEE